MTTPDPPPPEIPLSREAPPPPPRPSTPLWPRPSSPSVAPLPHRRLLLPTVHDVDCTKETPFELSTDPCGISLLLCL